MRRIVPDAAVGVRVADAGTLLAMSTGPVVRLVIGHQLTEGIINQLHVVYNIARADRRIVVAGKVLRQAANLVGLGDAKNGPVDTGTEWP